MLLAQVPRNHDLALGRHRRGGHEGYLTASVRRARLLLVIDEARAGRLTRAAAARALDMTLDDFLIAAGRHGLYAIDHDVEDFRQELEAISKGQL